MDNSKYPRTYHLPWSPGATKDDKRLKPGWFKYFAGQEVVFTEKLDGENTAMNQGGVFARSHGAETRSPWSRNLWDPSDGLYWKVRQFIGEEETVFGENLYGEHSIHYDLLDSYWHIFAVRDDHTWYSWDDVKLFARIMNVAHVPELYKTTVYSEEEVKEIIDRLMKGPSMYGSEKEGVVMRLAGSFRIQDFPNYVCKYVRANHVQTDIHWTKNWKRAKLVADNERGEK